MLKNTFFSCNFFRECFGREYVNCSLSIEWIILITTKIWFQNAKKTLLLSSRIRMNFREWKYNDEHRGIKEYFNNIQVNKQVQILQYFSEKHKHGLKSEHTNGYIVFA